MSKIQRSEVSQAVECLVCGDEYEHYDYLIDHVQDDHKSAEVYSELSGQSPYRGDDL